MKNPLSGHWKVITWQENLYDLDWLSEYVNLDALKDRRRRLPERGLGRNVNLFNDLRRWAYKMIHLDWHDYDRFLLACREQARELNTFESPLPQAEIRSTAKSVARWTWERRGTFLEGFSAWQRARGRKSGLVRKAAADAKRQMLLGLVEQTPSLSLRAVARISGIPVVSVQRLLKERRCS